MSQKLTAQFEYTDQELLAMWRECYAAIAVHGQSYSLLGRTYTRADLSEVQAQIRWLESRIEQRSTGLIRIPIRIARA